MGGYLRCVECIRFAFGFAALTISLTARAHAPVQDDLWDLSRGATVTGASGLYGGFDSRDIFGGVFSSMEPGSAIFSDGMPSQFQHYVEWRTAAPVTVR